MNGRVLGRCKRGTFMHMNILEGLKRLYIVFSVLLVVVIAGAAWADAGRSYLTGGLAGLGAAFVLVLVWLVLRWVISGFLPSQTRTK